VVVPYLREFISRLPPSELAHYGRRLQYSGLTGNEHLYVSGGSGLLMNRFTLGKLRSAIEKDSNAWAGPSTGPADLLMSRTLNKLGAFPKDTRDVEGRHVFIGLGLEMEYGSTRAKSPDLWFWKYSPDARDGKECCSKRWITSHYFKPAQVRRMCVCVCVCMCVCVVCAWCVRGVCV
jgi:glycoprotein-N-acetylgalactosamine 3-beta-galactosyltransferase